MLYSEGCANGLTLKDGEIEESTSGSSAGLGVRTILADGRQGIAYGNRLDRGSVDSLIEWSLHNARASQPEEGVMLYDGPLVRCPELEAEDEKIREITPKQRMEYCAQMTEEAKSADERIISVRSAAWRDGWGASFFATTKGLSQTVAALGGTQLETGTYTIVIDPDAAVPLVDAIGGLFCASDVHRGRSLMKGRIGDIVASPCVNLTDDGRVPWKAGSSSWDSEGVPTSRTELIKGGVASAFLYNLQYAAKDGVKSTGNCSRGMSSLPDVGTTNLIFEPGTESPQSLLSRVGSGMYVTEFMGLHTIDPVSGDFSIGAKGHRIINGEITTPVSGVTIASNLLEFMNDLTYSYATAAPTLVVDNVVIAGK